MFDNAVIKKVFPLACGCLLAATIGLWAQEEGEEVEPEPSVEGKATMTFRGKERLPWEQAFAVTVQRWQRNESYAKSDPAKDEGHKVESRVIAVPSKMKKRPSLEMHAMVPVDAQGQALPSAHDVVYFAPHIGSKKPLEREELRQLSSRYGMTVISFDFRSVHNGEHVTDRTVSYYYPESGSFDVLWEGLRLLRQEFRLEERKIWVLGESGGGSMAVRLGVLHEDKIVAVGVAGATRLDPIQAPNRLPWLIVNTRNDKRTEMNQQLAWGLQHYGAQVLFAQVQPKWDLRKKDKKRFRHVGEANAMELLREFVVSTRNLVQQNGGKLPPQEEWRVEDFDFEGHPVRLPSAEFAQHWGYQLPSMQRVNLPEGQGSAFVALPQVKPRGILVRLNEFGGEGGSLMDLADDLYYVARRWEVVGCAVSPSREVGADRAAHAAVALLKGKLKEHRINDELPVTVVAYGKFAGQIEAFRQDLGSRVRLVLINPSSVPEWLKQEQVAQIIHDEAPPKGVSPWMHGQGIERFAQPVALQKLPEEQVLRGSFCTYLDLALSNKGQ